MLLQVATGFHTASEQLFHIYCYRDPQRERLAEVLEQLSELQQTLLTNAADEMPPTGPEAPLEDVAWHRSTIAYGYGSLLLSKALLRAHPALIAAIQIELAPERPASSAGRIQYFRSLGATRDVLQEGAWKLAQIAHGLTGPEPEALRAITSAPMGEYAHKAVRSAATPYPPEAAPATAKTAAEAAGPKAQVAVSAAAVSSPATAARATSGARR
ncbi:hypothetical protein [Streptomyces sp. CBMA123]|uniref:hypothetical protein n=1 Tax=Streptomyces sp. CBMA123 TaxID=1896313 RepID=UPI001661D0CB|nr:hypothetical protein [Streptomyces sp. CBMA123]MBD0688306.1 hypothetical protein [Streptomyces sp. CBMA123]